MTVAVIGGGVCGLTASIELARQGLDISLFESAPCLGGRTRSYLDHRINRLVDYGPHLLTGAYRATREILEDAGQPSSLYLQPTLDLPLWEHERGLFHLAPHPLLPLGPALLIACKGLPGHGMQSLLGMLRLVFSARKTDKNRGTVSAWMDDLHLPLALKRDFLVPLCLGVMNERPEMASACSFRRVICELFANHDHARLGWFQQPISQALIRPLENYARQLGVQIHTGARVQRLRIEGKTVNIECGQRQFDRRFDLVILALPAWARNRLLNWHQPVAVNAIANLHLWFDHPLHLPEAIIGGIGTHGQWFFDINRMTANTEDRMHHICVVTSADESNMPLLQRSQLLCRELAAITEYHHPLQAAFQKLIVERRATVLVRDPQPDSGFPGCILDAGENPDPGDLPATIESAVLRGKEAAKKVLDRSP